MSGPKYQQIADAVLSKIASGEVGTDVTLGQIRSMTGATDATSRKAVAELVGAGILESHPGAPYTVRVTAEQASAARLDNRPLKDQVAELRQQLEDLRKHVGRIDARTATSDTKPRGGSREQAKAAASGGQR